MVSRESHARYIQVQSKLNSIHMAHSNSEWESLIKEKITQVSNLPATPPAKPATLSNDKLALTIDHTLLKPDATSVQIDDLCDEALKYKFKVAILLLLPNYSLDDV